MIEKGSRLTKRERKNLRKVEQEALRIRQEKDRKTKKIKLTGISALLAAATFAVANSISSVSTKNNPDLSFSPRNSPSEQIDDVTLIQRKAQELGIKTSQREKAVWEALRNKYTNPLPQHKGEKQAAIARLLDETVKAMRKPEILANGELSSQGSENPRFNIAYDLISQTSAKGNFNINLVDSFKFAKGYAATYPHVMDGKLQYTIEIDTSKVLVDGPLTFALVLTHESIHLRNMMDLRESMSDLTNQEFLDHFSARRKSREITLDEEVQGYAEGAIAYIYEVGLGSYLTSGNLTDDFTGDAKALIANNLDSKSLGWKNYIESFPAKWIPTAS